MKKILLIAITTLIAVSTGLSLEPMKVAFYTASTGSQTVHAEIKDYSSGTTLFVGEDYTLTPNDNGIVIINLKDNPIAGPTSSLSNVAATSVNTSVTVDIYVGTALFSQQRLDALQMAQAQNGVLDQNGNLTPPSSGYGDLGTDPLRWGSAYIEGSTIHIGPANGEANDTEMRLGYDNGTNTGTITIDDVDVIETTKDVITVNKLVHQDIGNRNTAFGTGALFNNTGGVDVTAIGSAAAMNNSGSKVIAVGIETAVGNNNTQVVAIGDRAAYLNKGASLTAVGYQAGYQNESDDVTAIGYRAGYDGTNNTKGIHLVAVGSSAAAGNTANYTTAVGHQAGVDNKGVTLSAFGHGAGTGNEGEYSTLIGSSSGQFNLGNYLNAFGENAADNNEGNYVNASGFSAAEENEGDYVNAIGSNAAQLNIGENVNAFGSSAARKNTGDNVTAIGNSAGWDGADGNSMNGQFIISNNTLPSYADRTAATMAITILNGAVSGNTYMYYNQATFTIEAVRLP